MIDPMPLTFGSDWSEVPIEEVPTIERVLRVGALTTTPVLAPRWSVESKAGRLALQDEPPAKSRAVPGYSVAARS
jgi:hypothetical protein